jgi:hypothetical protein
MLDRAMARSSSSAMLVLSPQQKWTEHETTLTTCCQRTAGSCALEFYCQKVGVSNPKDNDKNDKDAKRFLLYPNSDVKISRRNEVRFTVSSHGLEGVNDKTIYHGGQTVGTWETDLEKISAS